MFTFTPEEERPGRFCPGLWHVRSDRPADVSEVYCTVTGNYRGVTLRQQDTSKENNKLHITEKPTVCAPVTMAPWEDFDATFHFSRNFTYDGKLVEQIQSNRRSLENQLFVDRLLSLLGVKAGKLFSGQLQCHFLI